MIGEHARWWPFTASTALAVSMIGPTWLAEGTSAITLICMHVVVGVVVIAGFTGVRSRAARSLMPFGDPRSGQQVVER